jgi:hypothetical protein
MKDLKCICGHMASVHSLLGGCTQKCGCSADYMLSIAWAEVAILRKACKASLAALESHQAYDKDMRPVLRAALEATK